MRNARLNASNFLVLNILFTFMSKNLTKKELKNFVIEYNFHNIECAHDEWDIEKEKVEQCIYEIGAVHAMMNKYDIDPKVLPFEALVCQLRSCFVCLS